MIVVAYKNTMARAKPIAVTADPEAHGRRQISARDRVIELSRRWNEEQAKKRAAEQRQAAAIDVAIVEAARKHRRTRPYEPGNHGTSPKVIIGMVAAWHGLTTADILGDRRFRNMAAARHDAVAAVYLNCRIDGRRYSLPKLGRVFHRDHKSVWSSLRMRGLK